MTTVTNIQAIYLGNVADMDPNEPSSTWWGGVINQGAENASSVIGSTFGGANDPLYSHIDTMALSDGNNDGEVSFGTGSYNPNNPNGEGFTYGGQQVSGIDIGVKFTATVTYADPNIPPTSVSVRIMQDGDGNIYLLPPNGDAPASEIAAMTQHGIQSIQITAIEADGFSGVDTTRFGLATFVPCFASGTMIETDNGQVAIEELAVGDLVMTKDNGLQPIRWIGSRALSADELAANEKVQPIRIKAGALGNNTPEQDLLVSPQHRMLVRSKIAQRMFGAQEILVAAKQLCQIDGIDIAEDVTEVTYVHMLFDQHEVVIAEGAESESLYTGPQALEALGAAAAEEIFTLFPELRDRDYTPEGARVLASGRMARKLAVRHKQNNKQLVS